MSSPEGVKNALGTVFQGNGLISRFHECRYFTNASLSRESFRNRNPAAVSFAGSQAITLPMNVPSSAFYWCYHLSEVVLLDSVKTVADNAFVRAYNLTITIGTGLTGFTGSDVFYNDNVTMIIHATTPPTVNSSAFSRATFIAIYVPDDSVDAYKAATGWSQWASKIRPISQYTG